MNEPWTFTLAEGATLGRPIHGVVHPAANGNAPWVLLVHGFKGFMDWGFFPELARRLCTAGLTAVRFNLSGNGISSPDHSERFDDEEGFAHNTYSNELRDIDTVLRWWTAQPGVDPNAGTIFGHSRGGGLALLAAAAHPELRAVATWAAIEDVDRLDQAGKAAWRESGVLLIPNARTGQTHRIALDLLEDVERNRAALNILAACARIEVPLLLVHGTADAAVPVTAANHLHAANPAATLLIVEGADHVFGARHPLDGVPPDLERVMKATIEHFVRCSVTSDDHDRTSRAGP